MWCISWSVWCLIDYAWVVMMFLSTLMPFAEARSRYAYGLSYVKWVSITLYHAYHRRLFDMTIFACLSTRAWVSWCSVLSWSIAQTARIHFQALTTVHIRTSRLQYVLTNNNPSQGCQIPNLTTFFSRASFRAWGSDHFFHKDEDQVLFAFAIYCTNCTIALPSD